MAETSKCPICGKPSGLAAVRPFCSARCAQVDLGRWFTGAYAVPVDDEGREQDEPE